MSIAGSIVAAFTYVAYLVTVRRGHFTDSDVGEVIGRGDSTASDATSVSTAPEKVA
jgi:hypothetical protein